MTNLLNKVADLAVTNAMSRYTFGIIGNGKDGSEGKGIATGIGVLWKGTYLILTQIPDAITCQVDVFPAKRRKVQQAVGGNRRSLPIKRGYRLLQIHRIPEDDCSDDQIESARLVLQILPEPIADAPPQGGLSVQNSRNGPSSPKNPSIFRVRVCSRPS